MKSGKQRKSEIKADRIHAAARREVAARLFLAKMPLGAVAADATRMMPNNSYASPPQFYVDYAFDCRDCKSPEIWMAAQQKWWFEVAKGEMGTRAVRCRSCRFIERARAAEARRVSLLGLERKLALRKLKDEK